MGERRDRMTRERGVGAWRSRRGNTSRGASLRVMRERVGGHSAAHRAVPWRSSTRPTRHRCAASDLQVGSGGLTSIICLEGLGAHEGWGKELTPNSYSSIFRVTLICEDVPKDIDADVPGLSKLPIKFSSPKCKS